MNPINENVVNVGSTNTGSIRLRDDIVLQSFLLILNCLRFPDVLKVRLQMQHVGQRGPLIGMVILLPF